MFPRTAFLFLLLAVAAAAEPFQTKPDLMDAFPWTDSADGVKVAAPFLLNPTTVVPAGSVIRLFYVRPAIEEGEQKPRIFDNGDDRGSSVSRMGTGIQPAPAGEVSDAVSIPRALKKTLDTAHSTVWPNMASFRTAFDSMNGADLRVVYKTPGAKTVSDEPLGLLGGMLLSEKPDGVYVLAVQQGSDTAQAGIQAGDKIAAFDGQPAPSFGAFLDLYRTVSEKATLHQQKPYHYEIVRPGVEKPLEISIEPPVALGGSLIDQ